MSEFKTNAKRVSEAFASAGIQNIPLEQAAALLPTLSEWEEFVKAGQRQKKRANR